ncbi:MAG: glycosyltransferase [Parcubacteria group bacterium]|nr:glycosyltransferase [Parcubacteria group bacterium]
MKKICFVFPSNRSQLLGWVERGVSPDNGLYGLNHLRKYFDVQVVDVSVIWERILNALFFPAVFLFNSKHTKLNLARVVLALPGLNRADLAVTCVDSVNKAACLLKKLGILRRPLVCMAGNVLDGTEKWLFLHRWLWFGADRIIVHASVDQEKLARLGLSNKGIMVSVGSDERFWNMTRLPRPAVGGLLPEADRRNDDRGLIVSVGADRDRDYRTLFLAAEQLAQLKFIVCCGRKNVEGLKIPGNVEVKINVSPLTTREILSKAEIAVLPLRETLRASGQLAMLDAMLMGKPVIVSKTRGVVEAYGLEDKKQALLASPGNVLRLVQAIGDLHSNGNLRSKLGFSARKLAVGYTTKIYAEKLKKVILASS